MKKIINNFLRLFNLRLSNYKKDNLSDILFPNILNYFKISSVIDIGANNGQFADRLLLNGYKNKIFSIEPLSQLNNKLKEKSHKFSNWEILKPIIISNKIGFVDFYETLNSECSSTLLPKNEISSDYKIIDKHQINSITLSSLFKNQLSMIQHPICLKLDTQGNELEILKSGSEFLNDIKLLLIEVSFANDYQNQNQFIDLFNYLSDKNFEVWSVQKVSENFDNGKTDYLDIFFKNTTDK